MTSIVKYLLSRMDKCHVLLFTTQYSRYAKGGNFGFSTPKALSNFSPRLELATTLGQTGSIKKTLKALAKRY